MGDNDRRATFVSQKIKSKSTNPGIAVMLYRVLNDRRARVLFGRGVMRKSAAMRRSEVSRAVGLQVQN